MFFHHPFLSRPRLEPAFTDDLNDGEIYLSLSKYTYGSAYVGRLPCYFFLIRSCENDKILGQCDLRVGEHETMPFAGHIGYRIHSSHRGHAYAQKATRLLLAFAHRIGMEELLITCDPDNVASQKTLEHLAGDYLGCFVVPEDHVCYFAGDREKLRYRFRTEDFRQAIPSLND